MARIGIGGKGMSKYTVSRDLALLSTNELIEVFEEELAKRIQKDKEELMILEQIAPIFDIEEIK
jgi:hypothetical protein